MTYLTPEQMTTARAIRADVDLIHSRRLGAAGPVNSAHVATEQTLRARVGIPSYIAALDGPGNFLPTTTDPAAPGQPTTESDPTMTDPLEPRTARAQHDEHDVQRILSLLSGRALTPEQADRIGAALAARVRIPAAQPPFEFYKSETVETRTEHVARVIGEAIGAASVCWEDMSSTGVFDSTRAKQIADALTDEVLGTLVRPGPVEYPRTDGPHLLLGPEVFTRTDDHSAIMWKGQAYRELPDTEAAEPALLEAIACECASLEEQRRAHALTAAVTSYSPGGSAAQITTRAGEFERYLRGPATTDFERGVRAGIAELLTYLQDEDGQMVVGLFTDASPHSSHPAPEWRPLTDEDMASFVSEAVTGALKDDQHRAELDAGFNATTA